MHTYSVADYLNAKDEAHRIARLPCVPRMDCPSCHMAMDVQNSVAHVVPILKPTGWYLTVRAPATCPSCKLQIEWEKEL